jgi:carnitine-CoA ligase
MAGRAQLLHDVLRADIGVADDYPLVTFAADGTVWSKGQLRARSERAAYTLRAAGVTPGDRIAIMLGNCVEYFELCMAASMVGAIVAHLHTELRGSMLDRPLRLTQPKLIVAGDSVTQVLKCARPTESTLVHVARGSASAPPAVPRYEEIQGHGKRIPLDEVTTGRSASEPACIYSSSGTTGPSKGVTLSHAALYAMAETSQTVLGFGPADVAYAVTPFYHANALAFMFLPATLAGARTIFAERFSASRYWQDVARYGATRSSLVGSAAALLAGQPRSEFEGGTLELVAAVPRPKRAHEFERRFGTVLTEFYGSTEANLPLGIPAGSRCDDSCGRLLPGWEAKIADVDDNEVPVDTPGQLLIRPLKPWTVSNGYWGEPDRTVEMWRNLWIHTGDLMRQDADGWYYFIDRLKDAIRVSGENVPSAEIETVLMEILPGADVAAFGVPSDLGDQDIMVAIVPLEGTPVSLEDVIAECRARLPYFAVPRYAELVGSLPRTPTNRVKKAELRERGVRETTVDLGRPRRSAAATPPVSSSGASQRG